MNGNWIDITVPLTNRMTVWPGDPDVEIAPLLKLDHGDECNLTRLAMTAHAGTHIDAPRHYLPRGGDLAGVGPKQLCGPARVVGVKGSGPIGVEALRSVRIRPGQRVLFKTRHSHPEWWLRPFDPEFSCLSAEAAEWLAARKVRLVGIDYLSVGAPGEDGVRCHRALLSAGVVVLEGLNLAAAAPGEYKIMCLPLHLPGSDGAPARAFLRACR